MSRFGEAILREESQWRRRAEWVMSTLNGTFWQCLLKSLYPFVGDFGLLEVQGLEFVQVRETV